MKHKILLSVICTSALQLGATDLGLIHVESSTIDDASSLQQQSISSSGVIDRQEVEKINPRTAADLLSTIPGLTYEMTGTDTIKVHIRGIENQMYMGERPGVAIVIDGVPVQETAGKINVDLDNIESIKVIKGGASYLYGNDALSGAVIITTKKAKAQDSTKVEAEAGSYNSKRLLVATNQGFENSALQVQGSYRDTDGYWDDAFITIKSINGKYQYYIDDTSDVTFGLDYTKRETGDGNSVSGTIAAQTDPTSINEYSYSGYYDSALTKGFITYSKDFSQDTNLLLRLHKYQDDKEYKTARFTKTKDEFWDQNGLKSELKTTLAKSLGMMVGIDLQRNTTDELTTKIEDGSTSNDYDTKEDINALYTEVKYQLTNKIVTTLNARYDYIKHRYTDNEDAFNSLEDSYNIGSYRAGLLYQIAPQHTLFTSLSTGFRTPSISQVSSNRVAAQLNPSYNIQTSFDMETTYNYELGLRGRFTDLLSYEASIFQLDRKDYIGRVAGSYITSDNEEESYYGNVGDMRSRGFELALNTSRKYPLSADIAYTYLDAKFTTYALSQQVTPDPDGRGPQTGDFERRDLSGNYVPRTSKHTLNFTLHYQPTDTLHIATELRARSSYYADEINANKQAGYEVVNMRAEYSFNDSLEVFARIDNLLDKNYYQFVNISSSALATMEDDATIRVAPPRTYYAGLRYIF